MEICSRSVNICVRDSYTSRHVSYCPQLALVLLLFCLQLGNSEISYLHHRDLPKYRWYRANLRQHTFDVVRGGYDQISSGIGQQCIRNAIFREHLHHMHSCTTIASSMERRRISTLYNRFSLRFQAEQQTGRVRARRAVYARNRSSLTLILTSHTHTYIHIHILNTR